MSINQNLLNAVLLQYRGNALAARAAIEELLKKPSEDGIVEDITRQTKRLMEYEALMNTLRTYFDQKPAHPPQHAGIPPHEMAIPPHTRREMANFAKKRKEERRKKKQTIPVEELYPKSLDSSSE
jgi:hypothetical protein